MKGVDGRDFGVLRRGWRLWGWLVDLKKQGRDLIRPKTSRNAYAVIAKVEREAL